MTHPPRPIPRARRGLSSRVPFMVLVTLIGLLIPAAAQAQVLRIVDPPQWRESRPFTMQSRAPLRIAGFVSQAGGIERVLVNGVPAMLEADTNFPDSYNFERIVPVDSVSSQFTITVEPKRGDSWSRSFTIEVSTRPVERAETPPPAGQQAAGSQLRGSNPWGGFRKRGIIYGVAAVGGLVLSQLEKSDTQEVCEQTSAGFDCFNRTTTEPSYQTVGFAAAGGALAILVIDALLTSKKSGSPAAATGRNDGLNLEALSLSASPSRMTIDLLRLRF